MARGAEVEVKKEKDQESKEEERGRKDLTEKLWAQLRRQKREISYYSRVAEFRYRYWIDNCWLIGFEFRGLILIFEEREGGREGEWKW